ncbi:hypothetical protein [Streptomyces indicus]|uniref:hypothetical protein n=1 Tax=Streptomyces indicus TaxID=417292 RepID=UPI0015A1E6FF|nr:hypothetical protein [Streptomyces indicus]
MPRTSTRPATYRRNCGVYLARKAVAFAGARARVHEPEQAAAVGLQAVGVAAETGSARIVTEPARLDEARSTHLVRKPRHLPTGTEEHRCSARTLSRPEL